MGITRNHVGYMYLLLCFIVISTLSSCASITSDSIAGDSPKGWVVYGHGGSNILAINLETGEKSIIHSTNHTVVHMSQGENDELFFDECFGDCVIKKLNIRTKKVSILFEGIAPKYIREHGLLFFYKDGKLRYKEFRPINGKAQKINTVNLKNNFEVMSRMTILPLKISSNQLLVFDKEYNIHKYHIDQTNSTLMDMNGCVPKTWLEGRNKFLCYQIENNKHVIVSMDTLMTRTLDINVTDDLIYSPPYDALIYSSTPFFTLTERNYIYWKNLETNETYRIAPGIIRSGFWVKELNLN